MAWTVLDWIGLDWTACIGLDWVAWRIGKIGLESSCMCWGDRVGLELIGLGRRRLEWTGMEGIGLNWSGLGWNGMAWMGIVGVAI